MKSFTGRELILWMPKATKIKGGKFTLPWKGPFKTQFFFYNNTMELSTINDEGVEIVNINKQKTYHHDNPPTNVIITNITIDTRPSGKIKIGIERKAHLIFHLTCIPNQRIYLILTQNLDYFFNENDIEWIEEEDSKNGIPIMF
jgi:hypothetical protein